MLALTVAGCTTSQRDQRVAGAAAASGLGAGLLCAALGGGAGRCLATGIAAAAVGGLIANAMEPADRPVYARYANRVANNSALWSEARLSQPVEAKTVKWRNPDTNAGGEIVPLRAFTNESGQNCREASNIYKGKEVGTSTVCKGTDGVYRAA